MQIEKCCLDCKYFNGEEGLLGYEKAIGDRYCTWEERHPFPPALRKELTDSRFKIDILKRPETIQRKRPYVECPCWEKEEEKS